MNREQLEPLWNREHVERVVVVMKESISCEGLYSALVYFA